LAACIAEYTHLFAPRVSEQTDILSRNRLFQKEQLPCLSVRNIPTAGSSHRHQPINRTLSSVCSNGNKQACVAQRADCPAGLTATITVARKSKSAKLCMPPTEASTSRQGGTSMHAHLKAQARGTNELQQTYGAKERTSELQHKCLQTMQHKASSCHTSAGRALPIGFANLVSVAYVDSSCNKGMATVPHAAALLTI
jgi:hypothetical protein